jgi:hypothetical protein
MRYGFPYKGSKNRIAGWVCDNLPIAENFYDLFCGGCAITHLQLLRGRYKRYFMNDIEPNGRFFLDCIHGKYTTENQKRWISRETFFAEKESNPYIKWCWSFGNNGRDYLYSKEKEPYKKELWLEWERTGKKPRELCKNLSAYANTHNSSKKRRFFLKSSRHNLKVMVYYKHQEDKMPKKKKKPLSTSDKIALAVLIFEVIKWLASVIFKIPM